MIFAQKAWMNLKIIPFFLIGVGAFSSSDNTIACPSSSLGSATSKMEESYDIKGFKHILYIKN